MFRGMRWLSSVVWSTLAGTVLIGNATAGDCVDYAQYLHWIGGTSTGYGYGLATEEGVAYVAGDDGVSLYDVTDPGTPLPLGELTLLGQCPDVIVRGDLAYLLCSGGLATVDVADPMNPVLIGTTPVSGSPVSLTFSDTDEDLLFLAGREVGMSIYDISNPVAPVWVSDLETPGEAYEIVPAGPLAYVADYDQGVTVVSIVDPASPQVVANVPLTAYAMGLTVSGQNLFVCSAYLGLRILDISVPESPVLVGEIDAGEAEHVVVRGDYAHVVPGGGASSYQIIDVSDPSAPELVSLVYLGTGAYAIAISGSHAFLTGQRALDVIDISHPEMPPEPTSYELEGTVADVDVVQDYAYLAARSDGLQIVSVGGSNPGQVVASVPQIEVEAVVVQGSYAYAACYESGIAIVDVSQPESPVLVSELDTPNFASNVAVQGDLLVACLEGNALGFSLIDVSDRQLPVLLHTELFERVKDAEFIGDHLLLATSSGLSVYDIEDPFVPVEVASGIGGSIGRDLALEDDIAYLLRGDGIDLIDVSQPEAPIVVSSIAMPHSAQEIVISDGYAYIAAYQAVDVVDVTDPLHPRGAGTIHRAGVVEGIDTENGIVWTANRVLGGDPKLEGYALQCPGVSSVPLDAVTSRALELVGPNPFGSRCSFRYVGSLPEPLLDVYLPSGARVRSGIAPRPLPGARDLGYEFTWDGMTDAGRPASSGVYYVRVRVPQGPEADGLRIVRVR